MKSIKLKKGLHLDLDGKPAQSIHAGAAIKHVAWHAPYGLDLAADRLVREGQSIAKGEALFVDRNMSDIAHVAPASGKVVNVLRNARRALNAIEIECSSIPARQFELPQQPYTHHSIRTLLLTSGLWTQIRQRPFDIPPAIDSTPEAIFITAMDTRPLAPDPATIIAQRLTEFQRGVVALLTQTEGSVFVAQASSDAIAPLEQARVVQVAFAGPHPAGLAGTHIQQLHPIDRHHLVWHIEYQDVIAMGALLLSGSLSSERVVALSGSAVREPRLVRTHIGAAISDITRGELHEPLSDCHVVTGSILAGRQSRWLERFDMQVTVLDGQGSPDLQSARQHEIQVETPVEPHLQSVSKLIDTKNSSRVRGFVAEPRFDDVSPLGLLSVPLLRSLLMEDIEAAETLGCLQLTEDDLEPHAFVCPVGNDYPAALRRCLMSIRGAM